MQLAPLRRGFRVLAHVARRGSASFRSLQAELGGVGDASLTRLLKVLLEEELLVRNADGHYELGPAFMETASAALNRVPVAERIRPLLDKLAHRLHQTVSYWERVDRGMRVAARCEIDGSCAVRPANDLNPRMTRHPCGQLYLAWQDAAGRQRILETWHEPPVPPMDVFLERLDRIRAQGWFIDTGDAGRPQTRVAAAVTCGTAKELVGVLLVSAPGEAYPEDTVQGFRDELAKTAARMSDLLTDHTGATDASENRE